MERTRPRASANQVRRPSGRSARWVKVDLKSSSCAGFYNPRREAGEVCYQCVATVSLMRKSATPHADAFCTGSLPTRFAIAFVPTAAGLLTMPSWCRLCRKALAPSAPPRCARRGRLWGTTPKGARIKVARRSHIRCGFDTKRWVLRRRFAGCRMPCRRSLPRWSGLALW
jgi:hypothetical protein